MSGRSIPVYDPSGGNDPQYGHFFLMSSVPEVVDGKWYICMARVRLQLPRTTGLGSWTLEASILEVRVAEIPSNMMNAPWSDLSSDVYNIVADTALNFWSCAAVASVRTSLTDQGFSIGVRNLLAASFHSNSMFNVIVAANPGPGDEADQNVTLQCSAASQSPNSPVMFAYAVTISRTISVCNVLLFQHRNGQGSVNLTLQDNGGNLYEGSNESTTSLSVVVTSDNSPPRCAFRSIFPCSIGNVTVNMTTQSVPVQLHELILAQTAGRNEDAAQHVTMTVAPTSGLRLLQGPPFFSGSPKSLMLPLVPFLFGRLTLDVTATDTGDSGIGQRSFSRALDVTVLNVNNPPSCSPLSIPLYRRTAHVTNYTVNFSVCPGPGDEVNSQTASANFSGHLVSGFNTFHTLSSSGCSLYQVFLSIPGGFYGNTSQIECSAIDN